MEIYGGKRTTVVVGVEKEQPARVENIISFFYALQHPACCPMMCVCCGKSCVEQKVLKHIFRCSMLAGWVGVCGADVLGVYRNSSKNENAKLQTCRLAMQVLGRQRANKQKPACKCCCSCHSNGCSCRRLLTCFLYAADLVTYDLSSKMTEHLLLCSTTNTSGLSRPHTQ